MTEIEGKLAGRVAVITGGGHGIGRCYAERYAAEGARIAVLDIDEPAAKAVAAELQDKGFSAVGRHVDVSDEASTTTAVDAVIAEFGKVDILMNNAAIFSTIDMSRVPFDELKIDEWNRLMAVNVTGTWLMARAVAPNMRQNKYGKIINIGSGSLFKGTSPVHYVASKGAVYGFTHSLARELGGFGITVNCLCPGNTISEADPSEADLARHHKTALTRVIQREQVPDDILGAAVFLASTDSDFITGQTLVVDGGSHFH